jgi:hypothetical protein
VHSRKEKEEKNSRRLRRRIATQVEVDIETQRRNDDETIYERHGGSDVGDRTESVDGGEDFRHEDGEEGEVDAVSRG